MGVEYLSYVKSIETHALAFLPLNISAVGSVKCFAEFGNVKLKKSNRPFLKYRPFLKLTDQFLGCRGNFSHKKLFI